MILAALNFDQPLTDTARKHLKWNTFGSNIPRLLGRSHRTKDQMASSNQRQAAQSDPTSSQTQLVTPSQSQAQIQTQTQPAAILRLRGGHNPTRRSVQWSEDVVDNEGLGRKSSKGTPDLYDAGDIRRTIVCRQPANISVCCIYHKPKGVDESSDESSSDSSSSSSDSESDGGGPSSSAPRKQRAGGGRKGKKHAHECPNHDHSHNHDGERRPEQGDGSRRRRTSPNAYEKMPKYKPKDQGDGGGGSQHPPKAV